MTLLTRGPALEFQMRYSSDEMTIDLMDAICSVHRLSMVPRLRYRIQNQAYPPAMTARLS